MKRGSWLWAGWRCAGLVLGLLWMEQSVQAAAQPWPEAWQRLESVLVRLPDHDAAFERLAQSVEQSGRLAEWGERLGQDASSRADGADAAGWWALRARVAERLGQREVAAQAWQRVEEAVRAVPDAGPGLWRLAALAAERRGDWAGALAGWNAAAESAQEDLAVADWVRAGRAAVRVPDGAAARQAWLKVVERAEPGADAWIEGTRGLAAAGAMAELVEAVSFARQRAHANPEAFVAVEEAAWRLTGHGDDRVGRAVAVLSRLGPDHPAVPVWLRRGAEAAAAAGRPAAWAEGLELLAQGGAPLWPAAFEEWLQAGDVRRAERIWDDPATGLQAGPDAARRELALARAGGRTDAWLRLAQTAHERNPTDPERAADRASAAWQQVRQSGAGEEALHREVNAAWGPVLRAGGRSGIRAALTWAVDHGQEGLAEQAARRAVEIDPESGRTRTEAVRALVTVGRRAAARELVAADGGPWASADAALEAAERWRALDEPEMALQWLDRATQAYPGAFALRDRTWQLLVELGRNAEAAGMFATLRETAPTTARRAEVEARHLRLVRETAEMDALVAAARSWAGGEAAQMAWLWRAALEVNDGAALDRMLAVAAQEPLDLERVRLLDETARRRGDGHGRYAAWHRLAAEQPQLALLAWREAGAVAVAEQLWDSAAEVLEQLRGLLPGDPGVLQLEAEIALARGERDLALQTLEQLVQVGGGGAEVRWRLIQILVEDGRVRRAWPHLVEALGDSHHAADVVPVLVQAAAAMGRLPEAIRLLEAGAVGPVERLRRRAEVAGQLGDPVTALSQWLAAARMREHDATVQAGLRAAALRAPQVPARAEALEWLVGTATDTRELVDLLLAWAESGAGLKVLEVWRQGAWRVASAADWWRLRDALGAEVRPHWLGLVREFAGVEPLNWSLQWVQAEAELGAGDLAAAERRFWAILDLPIAPPLAESLLRENPDSLLQQALRARERYRVVRGWEPVPASLPAAPDSHAEAVVAALVQLAGVAAESGSEQELFARLRRWMEQSDLPRTRRTVLWLGMQARGPLMEEIEGFLAAGVYHDQDVPFLHQVLVNTRIQNQAGADGPRLRQLEDGLAAAVVAQRGGDARAFLLAHAQNLRAFGRRDEAGTILIGLQAQLGAAPLGARLAALRLAWETQQGELTRELLGSMSREDLRAGSRDLSAWLGPLLRSLGQGRDPDLERAALQTAWQARVHEDARRGSGDGRRVEPTALWQPPYAHPLVPPQVRAELLGLANLIRPGSGGDLLWSVVDELNTSPMAMEFPFFHGYLAALVASRTGRDEWAAAWWREQARTHPGDPWRAWGAARSALDPGTALELLPAFAADPALAAVVNVLRLELLDRLGLTSEAHAAAQAVAAGPPLSLPGVDIAALVSRHGGRWPPVGQPPGMAPRRIVIPVAAQVLTDDRALAILERPYPSLADESALAERRAAWGVAAAGPDWAALISERERQLALAPGAPLLLLDLIDAHEVRAGRMHDQESGYRAMELWDRLAGLQELAPPMRARVEARLRAMGDWRKLGAALLGLPEGLQGSMSMAVLVELAIQRGELAGLLDWALGSLDGDPAAAEGQLARWLELARALQPAMEPDALIPLWRRLADLAGPAFPDDLRRILVAWAVHGEWVDDAARWLAEPFIGERRALRRDVWLGRWLESQVPRWGQVQGGRPGGAVVWPAGEMVFEATPAVRRAVAARLKAAPESVRESAGGQVLDVLLEWAEGRAGVVAARWEGLAAGVLDSPAPAAWGPGWVREFRRFLIQHFGANPKAGADPLGAWLQDAMLEVGDPAAALAAATVAICRSSIPEAELADWLERLPTGGADREPASHLDVVRALAEAGHPDLAEGYLERLEAVPGAMGLPAFRAAASAWRVGWGGALAGWIREPVGGDDPTGPGAPAWRVIDPTGQQVWFSRPVACASTSRAPGSPVAWLLSPQRLRLPAPGWGSLQSGEPQPEGLSLAPRPFDFFIRETSWQVRAAPGKPGIWQGIRQAWDPVHGAHFSVWVRAWPGSTVRLGWRYHDRDGRLLRSRLGRPAPALGAWTVLEQRLVGMPPLPARPDREAPPADTATIVPFVHVLGGAQIGSSTWRPGHDSGTGATTGPP